MAREWTKQYWEKARTHARSLRWRRVPMWSILAGAFAALVAVILIFWDWNILKGPLQRYASSAVGREVVIDGDVNVVLGWTTHITLDRVNIANPGWAQPGSHDMARIERLAFDVRLWPLLNGLIIFPQVVIDRPSVDLVRERDGRANWKLSDDGSDGATMPPIGRLVVNQGRVHIADHKHAMEFAGTVESHEGPNGEGARAFVLDGNGTLGGRPFRATLTGDSPLRATGNPYAFDASMHMGPSSITARGNIPRPFDLDNIVAAVEIKGDDLANLYYITGLAFPNTPPYRLHGRLTRADELWSVAGLSGLVGHTDLNGTMSVDSTTDRPFLRANLVSKHADIDDIATVFGERPVRRAIPSAHAAAKPVATAAAAPVDATPAPETSLLLPDAPLRVERVRHMDARVHYVAADIKTGGVPMRELDVTIKLDHGVLTVDPARVTMALGKLSGRAVIDARHDVPAVDLNVHLTDAKIEQFFHLGRTGETPVAGVLEASARLHGNGASVYRAVANASGDIHLASPRGEVRQAIAELLGINLINGLGLLLTKDESTTPLRCAVVDFHADNGRLTVRRFAIDTGVVLATGTGSADLRNETMNITLVGHPKKFRLGRVMAPITITGHWAKPHIGVEAGKAVAQAGVGGALGALINPVAALLPFVSTGSQKDVDCGRLLAQSSYQPEHTPD